MLALSGRKHIYDVVSILAPVSSSSLTSNLPSLRLRYYPAPHVSEHQHPSAKSLAVHGCAVKCTPPKRRCTYRCPHSSGCSHSEWSGRTRQRVLGRIGERENHIAQKWTQCRVSCPRRPGDRPLGCVCRGTETGANDHWNYLPVAGGCSTLAEGFQVGEGARVRIPKARQVT